MTLAIFLEILIGAFKFPGELRALIQLLSKSDEEKRQEISDMIQKELKGFEDTNRP